MPPVRKPLAKKASLFIRYPVPVLAVSTLVSMFVTMGAVWGNWTSRVVSLEDQIHKVEQKLDVISNKIDNLSH